MLQFPLYALAVEPLVLPAAGRRLLDVGYWGLNRPEGLQADRPRSSDWDDVPRAGSRRSSSPWSTASARGASRSTRGTNDCAQTCDYATVCRIGQVRAGRQGPVEACRSWRPRRDRPRRPVRPPDREQAAAPRRPGGERGPQRRGGVRQDDRPDRAVPRRARSGPTPRPLGRLVALTFTEKAARELRERDPRGVPRPARRAAASRAATGGASSAAWRRPGSAPSTSSAAELAPPARRRGRASTRTSRSSTRPIAPTSATRPWTPASASWLAARDPDLIELAVEFGLAPVREALADLARRAGRPPTSPPGSTRRPTSSSPSGDDAWDGDGRPADAGAGSLEAADAAAVISLRRTSSRTPTMRDRRGRPARGLARRRPADDPRADLAILARAGQGPGRRRQEALALARGLRVGQGPASRRSASGIDKVLTDAVADEPDARAAAEHGLRFARLAAEAREAYDAAKRARAGSTSTTSCSRPATSCAATPTARASAGRRGRRSSWSTSSRTPTRSRPRSSSTSAGEAFAGGRLFLVGDFKQSIYRFRGAEPELFQRLPRPSSPSAGRLALTENFRSVPGVLDFVNALFADAFPERRAPPRPRPAAAAPPTARPPSSSSGPGRRAGDDPTKPGADEPPEVEARWLARLPPAAARRGLDRPRPRDRSRSGRPAPATWRSCSGP